MTHPDPLTPLLQPVAALPGISAALAGLLQKLAGETVRDLLFHLPEAYTDRSAHPTLAGVKSGDVATVVVTVVRQDAPQKPRQPWRVLVKDESGFAELVFFKQPHWPLLPGSRWVVSGKADRFQDRASFPHPDYLLPEDHPQGVPAIDPVWRLTAKLSHRMLAEAMGKALRQIQPLPEWHDAPLLAREEWPGFETALRAVQSPRVAPAEAARQRLAYDELLAHQLAIVWVRNRERNRPGNSVVGDGALRAVALERFGYTLTNGQQAVLAEIDADLAAPRRMMRLLQGDVGSGKTMIALLTMLRAVEAGQQAALMAPTELLARQHLKVLQRLSPVPVALLTGAVKGVERRTVLLGLASGRLQMVVGTHALFQDKVAYRNLGVAVIDEQHRFGVDQRVSLGNKGDQTDVLVMTATPIPRSLLLTHWGEMECSQLTEKPAGRQKIATSLHSLSQLDRVTEAVRRALAKGAQVYWVCPLVEENVMLDLAATEARFAQLQTVLGVTIGLAHGRQDTAIREGALAAFASGNTRLLVATTVIEVGVDVPAASVMVIEHAERFGLAQLHQLRGRVGRGSARSFCLLLHDDGLGETSRRRLALLRDTEDGFKIADEDFRMRGGGDLLGTRQSGQPGFHLADPARDDRLIAIARRDAEALLTRDPALETPRGQAARLLLRLFDRRAALRTLDSC